MLLTKGTVFSCIFKNKKQMHRLCFKRNSIWELFDVFEFPESSKQEKSSQQYDLNNSQYYLVPRFTKQMDLLQPFL